MTLLCIAEQWETLTQIFSKSLEGGIMSLRQPVEDEARERLKMLGLRCKHA